MAATRLPGVWPVSPYVPYRWMVDPHPRAPQRVGCEHPATLNLTMLGDPSERTRCANCGADWMAWPRSLA
jgi:hypothetical protein